MTQVQERPLIGGVIDKKLVAKATNMIEAIIHPFRMWIVEILADQGELCVGDIIALAENEGDQIDDMSRWIMRGITLSQAAVSQHLRKLKEARIIKSTKVGKNVYYSVRWSTVEKISQIKINL